MPCRRLLSGLVLLAALLITALSPAGATPAVHAAAQAPGAAASVQPASAPGEHPGAGTLMLRMPSTGEMLRAPAVETDVAIRVTGLVARTRVAQHFTNPTGEWVEGVYVFPLPEGAAVDRMRLEVGGRVIEGVLKERAEAKRTYQAAKRAGRRASLLEQERPNLFTTSVANLDPHGTVRVTIEYQERLRYDAGSFSLRFPMVAGPRYIPGEPLREVSGALPRDEEQVLSYTGTGWAADTTQVPDASRVTPPVLPPLAESPAPLNPVLLRVELDAGFALARLDSPSHALDVIGGAPGEATVTFAAGAVPADRDFVLEWTPAVGEAPRAALFTEAREDATYALLMVLPPPAPAPEARLAREVIFVIDVSGSMGGASIRQAKAALDMALARLADGDRFNVVAFNSATRRLFPAARAVDAFSVHHARRWVDLLSAGGGTEMAGALHAALDGGADTAALRQVVFLTDGAVGNEDALFDIIAAKLGTSRLFTVGIGSAPNSHFMRRAASVGRGSHTHIGDVAQVAERMGELFAKLEQPVMRDVEIAWPGAEGDVQWWPRRLPDLYAGEPLVLTARLAAPARALTVEGVRSGQVWHTRLPLQGGREERGIHALWARDKIASLEESLAHGAEPARVREQVVAVALRHGLVTRHTSLVAVDVTPARDGDAALHTRAVPTNLPAGWQYDKVFGALPRTATPAPGHLLAGLALLALAALARGRRRTR